MTERDDFNAHADAVGNYAAALAAIRLKALITGQRWAVPEDTFDLVLAAALMRSAASGASRRGSST